MKNQIDVQYCYLIKSMRFLFLIHELIRLWKKCSRILWPKLLVDWLSQVFSWKMTFGHYKIWFGIYCAKAILAGEFIVILCFGSKTTKPSKLVQQFFFPNLFIDSIDSQNKRINWIFEIFTVFALIKQVNKMALSLFSWNRTFVCLIYLSLVLSAQITSKVNKFIGLISNFVIKKRQRLSFVDKWRRNPKKGQK